MSLFFFHKLFCLLQNVIIPVFGISEKEDISGCRSCSNICVYLLFYTKPKTSRGLELKKQVEAFLLGWEGEALLVRGFCFVLFWWGFCGTVLLLYSTADTQEETDVCIVDRIF